MSKCENCGVILDKISGKKEWLMGSINLKLCGTCCPIYNIIIDIKED